ncbi:YbaB/EbfC family nucleoid-associated protein [Amycolatopsis sp. NPDC059657]|uniref:YbaB/EbfC family nucleoid-associated protein n=1 Tax=Amycolatopsis sp. NPDC059657 TaxID=3346899 RepID=UPI00366FF70E
MSNPEQLITDYEAKLASVQENAARTAAEIESVTVSERSKDGQIAVKVNHTGNVVDLEIGTAVRMKPSLAQDIMRTIQGAQAKLAGAMQAGVPSIAGTETMDALVSQLHSEFPEPEPEGYVEGGYAPAQDSSRFVVDEEPAAPQKPAPPRPARPARDEGQDEDYFGGGFLR